MKSCLSSNLKKIWTKEYIGMSYMSFKENLRIFQWQPHLKYNFYKLMSTIQITYTDALHTEILTY